MKILAGVDEVGRGSLIGPVYAAAVILNNSIDKKLLKDSKTLTKDKREELEKYIKKNSIWAIGQASTKEIEKMNILHSSLLAMKRAILKLKTKPSLVLIDGNKMPNVKNYKLKYVIKGDQKIPSISAASIIAKVTRDKFITTRVTDEDAVLNYINDFRFRHFGIKEPYNLMSPSDTFLEDEIFKTVSDDDDGF